MYSEETELKILDSLQAVFTTGEGLLGLTTGDWEEYALDALVENIDSFDLMYIMRCNEITTTLKLEIEAALLKRAKWILDDATKEQVIGWGFGEILKGE